MRKRRIVGVVVATALVACGLDVVGVDPISPDGSEPGADGSSTTDAKAAKSDGATDASKDDAGTGAADTGPLVDANVCAECPAGTAHKVCSSTGCLDGFRVFVTSTKSNANLGADGVRSADAKCQALATATGLGGTWRAWISSSASDPAGRFTRATVPYRLLDGTVLATSFDDLTNGDDLTSDIHLDEKGTLVTAATGGEAWTGTDADGTYSGSSCDGFTTESSGSLGTVGVVYQKNSTWSNVYKKTCDSSLRLYCFEQ